MVGPEPLAGRARRPRGASFVLLLLSVLGGAGGSEAQTWTSWSLHWENDSFVPPRYGSDQAYTNGVRFTLGRDPEETWGWAEALGGLVGRTGLMGGEPFATTGAVAFGQNFFTPVVITTFEPDREDRPFAAFLYGGVHVDVTEDEPVDPGRLHLRLQHAFELDGGFVGPLALADQVQTGVHLLRESRIPKGWKRQLGTEVAVNASYLARAKVGWHFLDAVPHVGVALGTVQTYGSAGTTARVGWNMSAFPTLLNPWTAVPVRTRPSWEIALAAGIEGRHYLRNAYVDGNLVRGSPAVDRTPGVADYRLGATARVGSWWLAYTFVRRTREFEAPAALGEGEHDFGSLSLTRELGTRPAGGRRGGWLGSDWTFEAGIGGGISRDLTGGPADETLDGMSMRVGLAKGLAGGLALGAELVGVLREADRPDADGRHRDAFLLNRAATLAWRPALGRGLLSMRGGVGSALLKVESTLGLDRETERSDSGVGWLAALGYELPLADEISLGLDATFSHLGVGTSDGAADAAFLSTTLGFKWHP